MIQSTEEEKKSSKMESKSSESNSQRPTQNPILVMELSSQSKTDNNKEKDQKSKKQDAAIERVKAKLKVANMLKPHKEEEEENSVNLSLESI